MRTTSHPQRRSTGSHGNVPSGNPIKSIRLAVTLGGPARAQLERLAAEKGLRVEERGETLYLVIDASSPEDALAELGRLTALVAPKA